jgi:hypothetical protein
MTKKRALTAIGGVILASLAGASPPAQAQENMTWGGGPMRNLYIDVIFWGNFCPNGYMCPQAQNVLDYVNYLTAFLRGNDNPPGLEPAIHYYGVSEIYPGDYVVGPQSLGSYGPPGTGSAGIDQVQAVVAAAQNGSYGGAYEVANSSNWVGQSLPTGSNRLALVVTLGGNNFDDYGAAYGFHGNDNQTIYAAAQWEHRWVISHEIFESMTDPFNFSGWAGDLQIPLPEFWSATYPEVADQCESDIASDGSYTTGSPTATSHYDSYLSWSGRSEGGDISGLTGITVNPPFSSAYTALYGATCEVFIPEQHAPMAATFEYGYRSQPLSLFYVDVHGAVQDLQWNNAGQPLSSQFSFGPPSSTVSAVGKPAVVYVLDGVGERVFVKGSDGQLWMHYYPNGGTGTWLSLGGQIYGDPAPVLLNNGQLVDVYAVGIDDHLYWYGLTGSTLYGWSSVPDGNGFLASPKVVSRDANTFDIFAPTENGKLEWIAYNTATGWAAPVALPDLGGPDVVTPVVTFQTTTQMQVFENSTYGMFQTMWNGSSWYYATDTEFEVDRVDQDYGLQGGLAVTSWGTGHLDAFGITRTGNLYWWWTNNPVYPNTWRCWEPGDCTLSPSLVGNANGVTPLISGAPLASGDPLAISRSAGETEVFYRALADGSLVHLTYSNGAWQVPEYVPASIQ